MKLRMNFKFKIKSKIMLMNMGILIPAIIFIYFVTLNTLYNNVVRSSIDFLTKESYSTQIYIINYIDKGKGVFEPQSFKNMSSLLTTYLSNNLKFRVQLYDDTGGLLADSTQNSLSLYDEDINNAIKGNKSYVVKKIDGHIYILFASPIYINDKTIGCVRYVYPVDSGEKLINTMFIIMGVVAIIAIVIAWILSNLFSESIAQPINKLKYMSEKVAFGDYDHNIEINSGDEIEDLSTTFNVMAQNIKNHVGRLKEEKQKQKDFLDNVTHEFKTPLTAIIGYSDLIPRLKDKEDIDESLTYIQKEGQRLLDLVEELLDLSKLGKTEFNIEKKENDLKELIEEVLYIVKPRIDKYRIQIESELFNSKIYIDRDKTKQVILNVVDNCIKYSECSKINFCMRENDTNIILNIIDDGIGILEEEIDKIFEPFCRVDKMSSREKSGNGLGLSIAKEIMTKQDGFINIYSAPGEGTDVEISFKK